jgi:hypothetical protein
MMETGYSTNATCFGCAKLKTCSSNPAAGHIGAHGGQALVIVNQETPHDENSLHHCAAFWAMKI